MSEHFKLLIPGATPAGTTNVTAPYDGAQIATIETGGADAVEIAPNNASISWKKPPTSCSRGLRS